MLARIERENTDSNRIFGYLAAQISAIEARFFLPCSDPAMPFEDYPCNQGTLIHLFL